MPKVVSNTTPILSLLKIGRLELLKDLYGKVLIPNAVFEEIEKGKLKPYYQNLKELKWIEILEIIDKSQKQYFSDLDAGEAEVLILSKEIKAELVLLDEILGRRFAEKLGLKITGTIGIILKAKEMGFITKAKDLIAELREKGTWISPKLYEKILEISDEK